MPIKTRELLVRCMVWRTEGQWVALCLDFDLAAQDDTPDGAVKRLHEQIKGYVREALVGEDKEFAADFLLRRAPLRYWLKFYWAVMLAHLDGFGRRGQRPYREPLPMQPA